VFLLRTIFGNFRQKSAINVNERRGIFQWFLDDFSFLRVDYFLFPALLCLVADKSDQPTKMYRRIVWSSSAIFVVPLQVDDINRSARDRDASPGAENRENLEPRREMRRNAGNAREARAKLRGIPTARGEQSR